MEPNENMKPQKLGTCTGPVPNLVPISENLVPIFLSGTDFSTSAFQKISELKLISNLRTDLSNLVNNDYNLK